MKASCVQPKLQFIHGSKKYWVLLEDIDITLSNGDNIKIPKGFTWDLSSVPKLLWWLCPPFGDFMLASLIHDWIYATDYRREEMGDFRNKWFADREMFLWSEMLNKSSWWSSFDNLIRYFAVTIFGWRVFKRRRIDNLKKLNCCEMAS